MRPDPRAHNVVVLHERLEALTSQLAELEDLRVRVFVAEHKIERIGGKRERGKQRSLRSTIFSAVAATGHD